jgi:predicted amidohydrolase YtcJ
MRAYLFYNGPIYTMDPAQPQVQALLVRGGRIAAVGSEGHVQAAAGGKAELINLRGRALIPALTDAHVHLGLYAVGRRRVQLEGAASYEQALAIVQSAAAALPADAWIVGWGWDHTAWGRWPAAEDLDTLLPGRPIMLSRKDGHSAWCSSAALRRAGITESTPDPAGGTIGREQGRVTGLLFETAIDLVRQVLPEPTEAERLAALQDVFAEAHGYGMASVHIPPALIPGDGALTLRDLQTVRGRNQLGLRCLAHLGLDTLAEAVAVGLRSGLGDRWLRIGGVKMFADGSLGSETAEMLSHYERRRHLGAQTIDTETLNAAVRQAHANGLSVIVHAIGDAANRRVLDAIMLAQRLEPQSQPTLPHRIEHCQVLHPRDLPRFAQLGVVASMQPVHCTSDIEAAERLWGPERCQLAYAWRALLDSGAVLAFGSDAPVEPLNPWLSVHAAVNRRRPSGTPDTPWVPAQRLTVAETLWAFTVGPAYAAGMGHELGTLTPGALADLAVLTENPYTVEPMQLHAVRAALTMVEGEIVYHHLT